MFEFVEASVAASLAGAEQSGEVDRPGADFCTTGVVGELYNLQKIEDWFQQFCRLAIHCLDVRGIEDQADGRVSNHTCERCRVVKVMEQQRWQSCGVYGLEAEHKPFVRRTGCEPRQQRRHPLSLFLARQFIDGAAQHRNVARAKPPADLKRFFQIGLDLRLHLCICAPPGVGNSPFQRCVYVASHPQPKPVGFAADRRLLGRRTRSREGILNTGKSLLSGKASMCCGIDRSKQRREHRRRRTRKAEMAR